MNFQKKFLEFKFLKLIHKFFKKGEIDKAIELLKQKLLLEEGDWDDSSIIYLYLTLAYGFYLKEDFEKSKRYLTFNLLKEFPENGQGLFFLAFYHLLENDKPQAITLYTKLLKNPACFKKSQEILNKLKDSEKNFVLENPAFFYKHQFFLGKRNNFTKIGLGTFFLFLSLAIFYNFDNIKEVTLDLKAKFSPELEETPLPEPFNHYFNEMKRAIAENKINEAIVLFNQALFFSPDLVVREKFEILREFVVKPELKFISDQIPWEKIKKNPSFYENTFFKIVGKFQYKKKNYHFKSLKYPAYEFTISLPENVGFLDKRNTYQVFFQFSEIKGDQLFGKGIGIDYINTTVSP